MASAEGGAWRLSPPAPKPQRSIKGPTVTSKAPPLAVLTAWAAATTVAKAGSIAKGVKLSLLLNWEMVA